MRNKESQTTNGKAVSSNASPSAYGWCFQVGAGITLMLDNVKEFTSLKMEGASDDIELTLDAGKIYAQAKSVTKIGDQSSASTNLTNALRTLSQDSANGDAVSLIYITNIANPLSSETSSAFRYDRSYEFSVLPDDAQEKIRKKVADDFPADKFKLHILNFFGEGDNKFDSIKVKIAEFIREAIDDPSYNKRLLDSWFETFMVNASDKPDEQKKPELKKKDVIYPVIVLVVDSLHNERLSVTSVYHIRMRYATESTSFSAIFTFILPTKVIDIMQMAPSCSLCAHSRICAIIKHRFTARRQRNAYDHLVFAEQTETCGGLPDCEHQTVVRAVVGDKRHRRTEGYAKIHGGEHADRPRFHAGGAVMKAAELALLAEVAHFILCADKHDRAAHVCVVRIAQEIRAAFAVTFPKPSHFGGQAVFVLSREDRGFKVVDAAGLRSGSRRRAHAVREV
jgi:hypothetical protein